jgi:tripartite-type tricarboxylate transporter receptor subunit TctC
MLPGKMMNSRQLIRVFLALALFASMMPSFGQTEFPNRPIKLIIPFPPGGPTDIYGRLYAQSLSNALGVPVVSENKGGAAGAIGSAEVKRSNPDGYTLLFATVSTHSLYNLLSSKPQYDAIKDFSHIAVIGEAPIAFAFNPSMPATFKEYVSQVRANPTKYSYGSSGEGTFLHYAGERLKVTLGQLPLQHIPYKGSGASLPALMAGEISMTADTLSTVINHHKSGKVRIMGIASNKRFPMAPDIPTVNEALGLSDFEIMAWYAIMAPVGLPDAIMQKLAVANDKALSDPALLEKITNLSIQATPGITRALATQFVRKDIERLAPVIKALNFKLD